MSISSIMPPNNRRKDLVGKKQVWVSSKKRLSADYIWSNRSDKQTEFVCSQGKIGKWGRRKRRKPQSVRHNLITPICHSYTWTHTAADLLVQMMQKQNKGEIFYFYFFCRLTRFSDDRLEKKVSHLKIWRCPLWGSEKLLLKQSTQKNDN